nr:hypothetical protein [uncultured Oscillibacter sp.]
MRDHPKLSRLFLVLALLLSHTMCATVASEYTGLVYCGRYGGCSAPPSTAFLLAVPFLFGVLICLGLARASRRR